jgi:hypothetical protein
MIAGQRLFLLAAMLPAIAAAQTAGTASSADAPEAPKRDELIIHGSRNRPLSEWDRMREHSAEFGRLRARFDPERRQTSVDSDAAARDFASSDGGHALQRERNAPVVVDHQD